MKPEFYLQTTYGKVRPFRVPDDYFASFPSRLIDKLLANEAVAGWEELRQRMNEDHLLSANI